MDEKKKLLHERLKEFDGIGAFYCLDSNASIVSLREKEAQALADEIQRYYIPCPRFEDGSPVHLGSMAIGEVIISSFSGEHIQEHTGKVIGYEYDAYDGAQLMIELENGENIVVQSAEGGMAFKHPALKAFDADGVPINVGDTVWDYEGDGPFKVDKISGMNFNGQPFIHMDGHDVRSYYASDTLIHHEPDSLKKLLNDISEYSSEHVMPGSDLEKTLNRWIDRTTALVEKRNEKL